MNSINAQRAKWLTEFVEEHKEVLSPATYGQLFHIAKALDDRARNWDRCLYCDASIKGDDAHIAGLHDPYCPHGKSLSKLGPLQTHYDNAPPDYVKRLVLRVQEEEAKRKAAESRLNEHEKRESAQQEKLVAAQDRLGRAVELAATVSQTYGDPTTWDTRELFLMATSIVNENHAAVVERRALLDDGFGNQWKKCERSDCGLEIVRPGKVQCGVCDGSGVRFGDSPHEHEWIEVTTMQDRADLGGDIHKYTCRCGDERVTGVVTLSPEAAAIINRESE